MIKTAIFVEGQTELVFVRDPETAFFHPAKQIEDIYLLVNENYNKSKGNINAIMSHLQKNDFKDLANSGKCLSFKKFQSLLPIP